MCWSSWIPIRRTFLKNSFPSKNTSKVGAQKTLYSPDMPGDLSISTCMNSIKGKSAENKASTFGLKACQTPQFGAEK